MSREEAERIITPRFPLLIDTLDDAWSWLQDILDEDPERRSILYASTQAAMVYDCFVCRLAARIDGEDGVHVHWHGRMLKVDLDRRLSLRFKRFDNDLCSRNVRTNSQAAIYFQLDLPGVSDPLTDVTFGYVTDVARTKIIGMYITCPIGWSRNKWLIVVDEGQSDATRLIEDPSGPEAPIIKPKKPRKRASGA